jgi:hypothetical protein
VRGILGCIPRHAKQHSPFDIRCVAVHEDRQRALGGGLIARARCFA